YTHHAQPELQPGIAKARWPILHFLFFLSSVMSSEVETSLTVGRGSKEAKQVQRFPDFARNDNDETTARVTAHSRSETDARRDHPASARGSSAPGRRSDSAADSCECRTGRAAPTRNPDEASAHSSADCCSNIAIPVPAPMK